MSIVGNPSTSVRGFSSGLWAAFALCMGVLWLSAPPAASAPTLVSEIMAGQGSSCAVTTTGAVKCWGWNFYGQLGVGTDDGPQNCGSTENPIACSTTPVAVSGLDSGVSAMASGSGYAHTCALTTAGGVKCWGYAAAGALGNGNDTGPDACGNEVTVACSTTPVAVSGLDSGASAIATGWNHTCALTTAGGVKCWGGNSSGALGDGTAIRRTTPVEVQLSSGASAIAAGEQHTCALTSAGDILCWGSNRFGQLGVGTDSGPQKCGTNEHGCSTTPIAVELPSGVTATAVAAGGYHTCALTTAGGVECWGSNRSGQLGNGTDDGPQKCSTLEHACSTTPAAVGGLEDVIAISAGADHTCALTSAGGARCWGDNVFGQLGVGSNAGPQQCGPAATPCSTAPVAVSGLDSGASAVAAGWSHTCALTSIGGVECWGHNRNGGLGTGDILSSFIPVQVSGLSGARMLSVSVAGAGKGAVSSTPAGIDCDGLELTSCSASFAGDSTVVLRASAGLGSGFVGFAGGNCSAGESTCEVTMGSERSVTATFALPPSASIVAPPGGGTYAVGQSVATSFSCAEGASGPGLTSCDDSTGTSTTSGGQGHLDTSTEGLHAYTVTAVSKDGLANSTSIGYRVGPAPEPPGGHQPPPAPRPPAPQPQPGPPSSLQLSLRVERKSLRKLLRTGKLVVAARVNGAARVALTGRAKVRVRARRKVRTKFVTVFTRKTVRFAKAGRRKVTLRLSRKGRRKLRRLRKVRLAIAGGATDAAGDAARRRVALTLRRRARGRRERAH